MGNGPARIAEALPNLENLTAQELRVEERPFELGTAVRVWHAASATVRDAIADHRFPILLAGGCINSLAALSAIGPECTALIWCDAHADFNTPETTPSGFVDGMALATITGRCWRTLAATVPGFRPLPEKNVVLIGARDLDLQERLNLVKSEITWLSSESIRKNGVESALTEVLLRLPKRVYFHIDLDVLDRAEAQANEYSSTGGLNVAELMEIIRFVGHHRTIVGASITAYDPSVDHDSRALRAAVTAVQELLTAACIDVK